MKPETQPDWYQLAIESVKYRDSKGFKSVNFESIPNRLMNIFCEIEELTDALYESQKLNNYEAVRSEISDIIRYSLAALYDLSNSNWTFRHGLEKIPNRFSSPEILTAYIRRNLRSAFEAWRNNKPKDLKIYIELIIVATLDLRDRVLKLSDNITYDIDKNILDSVNRPELHGNKRSDA